MSEIQLLRECLNSQSEAEAGGVKFVWMDDNTVYRFENNRMKKVSKALINKAKKADVPTKLKRGRKTKQLMGNEEEEDEVLSYAKQQEEQEQVKPTKTKRVKQPKPIYDEDDEQEQNEVLSYAKEQEQEPIKPMKTAKRAKQSKPDTNPANIDLNEYYHNKNKMEFMQQEMERMNKKITKLKQYKSMFNRLNGGEYDIQDTQQIAQPKQNIPENTKIINDSLFLSY